jgi:hypothetical protein
MEPLYHPTTLRQLDAIKAEPASYIFAGSRGSGRVLAATKLAIRLNCLGGRDDNCAICQNIRAGSFSDVLLVDANSTVGTEQIQEIQQALAQRPFSAAATRIVVIEASLGMTPEAQNRLLSLLEEPPSQTIIILVAESPDRFLITVQSRCRVIQFLQPDSVMVQEHITKRLGQAVAKQVQALRPVSVGEALLFASDQPAREERQHDLEFVQEFITSPLFQRLILAQQVKLKARATGLIELMARVLPRRAHDLSSFMALEHSQAMVQANVGPRAAIEALALTL